MLSSRYLRLQVFLQEMSCCRRRRKVFTMRCGSCSTIKHHRRASLRILSQASIMYVYVQTQPIASCTLCKLVQYMTTNKYSFLVTTRRFSTDRSEEACHVLPVPKWGAAGYLQRASQILFRASPLLSTGVRDGMLQRRSFPSQVQPNVSVGSLQCLCYYFHGYGGGKLITNIVTWC